MREDVVQDMILDLHSGEIAEADICPKLCRRYITEHYKRYEENRYNTLSLDQPSPGKENGKLGDQIRPSAACGARLREGGSR